MEVVKHFLQKAIFGYRCECREWFHYSSHTRAGLNQAMQAYQDEHVPEVKARNTTWTQ